MCQTTKYSGKYLAVRRVKYFTPFRVVLHDKFMICMLSTMERLAKLRGQHSKLSDLHKTYTGKPLENDHLQDQEEDETVILTSKHLITIVYHQSSSYLDRNSASTLCFASANAVSISLLNFSPASSVILFKCVSNSCILEKGKL